MKFICLGYLDESGWANMPEDKKQGFMNECFDYHDALVCEGHVVGGEALDSARNAVTLRRKGGAVEVTDGPYAETKELLAGLTGCETRSGYRAAWALVGVRVKGQSNLF